MVRDGPPDGEVAVGERHVAGLTLVAVVVGAVTLPAVAVAVLLTRLAGEQEDDRRPDREADAALAGAAGLGVQRPAPVELAGDEARR